MNFLKMSSGERRNRINAFQSLFPDKDPLEHLITTADIMGYEHMTPTERRVLRTKLAGEFNLSTERLNHLLREGPKFLPSKVLNPTIALYVNEFVEWDVDRDEWVSYNKPNQRETKLAYLKDIDGEGASNVSREIEFLLSVEKDIKVRKKLERLLL